MAFVIYLKYYSLLVLLLCGLYLIGSCVLWPVRKNIFLKDPYAQLFVRFLLGLTLAVLVYSCVVTGLRTINLAFSLILVFLWMEVRKKKCLNEPIHQEKPGIRHVLVLFIASVIIFGWFATLILKPESNFGFWLPDKDKIYYAVVSDMLSLGFENRAGVNNLLDAGAQGAVPYHYFELWLTNYFSLVTHVRPVVTLYVFTYPVLNLVIFMGLLAVAERAGKPGLLMHLLVFGMLFAGGFYFTTGHTDFSYAMNFGESPMEYLGEKYGSCYLFVIPFCLLFMEGRYGMAFFVLLALPVVAIGTAPSVFISILLMASFLFYQKKLSMTEWMKIVASVFSLIIFMLVFYWMTAPGENPYVQGGLLQFTDLNGLGIHSVKVFLIELVYRIAACPWKFLLLHLPFVPAVYFLFKGKTRNYDMLLIYTIGLYVVSLFLYGIFYKFFDGIQFYTNNFVFVNCFCAITIISLSSRPQTPVKWALLLPVFLILAFKVYFSKQEQIKQRALSDRYTDAFMLEVKRMAPQDNRELVGAIYGDGVPEINLRNDDKSGVNCFYTTFVKGFYPVLDLGPYNVKEWSREKSARALQQKMLEQIPFVRSVNEDRSHRSFKTVEQSRVDFIKKHKIRYLIISSHTSADTLLERMIDRQVKDEHTGERFVHLNYH